MIIELIQLTDAVTQGWTNLGVKLLPKSSQMATFQAMQYLNFPFYM